MLRSTISSWREYLTPISHKSTFLSTGQITPEEFVLAGDYLVHRFPIWKWNESVVDVSVRDFLPAEKQFLVIRKVPCMERAQDMLNVEDERGESDNQGLEEGEDDMDIIRVENNKLNMIGKDHQDDIDELMRDMELHDSEDEDVNSNVNMDEQTYAKRRYYDLYITYSTSYRVPKMYMVGFNGDGSPLTPEQMFEDISADYRAKTATIENLPFYKPSIPSVSIHPCKHANIMKILLEKVRLINHRRRSEQEEDHEAKNVKQDTEDWEDLQKDVYDTLRADQYLVIFLKFITSVTPTIEHDYTMEGW
ncbi:hypothetical protein NCAS_0G00990 [Naumovozyma castellii]|uniref:Autophagy-related protein 3 n=1 Tax=Naumovozyma castellii TaxID=27288 RepID=G0VHV2_NAUCA|nr:hypothetical protein NCAS_0G00990 [Naumovozyma castellii CBS 4309]CCC70986.1 hypothetical protein NCAS_0G00990 [Naumovozyma castellii CBS 4309]